MTRREAIVAGVSAVGIRRGSAKTADRLDRKNIVDRHSPRVSAIDTNSVLQVGNGEFAFAVDVTGLQTFYNQYQNGMPLGTMAQWAWHSFRNTGGYKLSDVMKGFDSHGREVLYPVGINEFRRPAPGTPERAIAAATWLRTNPQRIHLARIGLIFPDNQDREVPLAAISAIDQRLDLWTGRVESHFQLLGSRVFVETVCHPQRDLLAVKIASPLLFDIGLGLLIGFPYASTAWTVGYDWDSPDKYATKVVRTDEGAVFESVLDETHYWSACRWTPGARLQLVHPHIFQLTTEGSGQLEFTIEFSPRELKQNELSVHEVQSAAAEHWCRFWETGGAIELSDCTDERAPELERRIVLSQYVTAVNCAGSMPPQETGLVTNSWYGKSHLEMHWWHAAHFVLWGRPELLERSLPWYEKVLPHAKLTAREQGYRGARWPKEVGPEGRETPSDIGVFLIWQQPHPIFYSELLYRVHPSRSTLNRYEDIVFETAEFMASYAAWDNVHQQYVLGPPLIPAQESYQNMCARLINPTFELAYWHWGLSTAQTWRERLGLDRMPSWDVVIRGLSAAPVRRGIYAAIAVEPYTLYNDHPSMLCALGMLPQTSVIDPGTMARTINDVLSKWNWPTTWGWDYPVIAMAAARRGQPDTAVNALLMKTPKNVYLPDGFNLGRPGLLPLYIPGNGGLLYAVALMAAGWDGSPSKAPGFPKNGKWPVKFEGLHPAP